MAYICSLGLGIPSHELSQNSVKELVKNIFTFSDRQISRLLPVFDNALIENRQLVVDKNWFKENHSFQEKNDLYQSYAKEYSLQAIDDCMMNDKFLTQDVPYEAIDMIIFVSSTGISTPSMDTYLMNERDFREDIARMPLWGLGCAGGAIGLSRANDWLQAHPEKTVLLVCCELCSLTFQKEDTQKSNLIGTALFGDGISAALLAGEESKYLTYCKHSLPRISQTSSLTKKDSNSIMGWNVSNNGLEVVFSKSIPSLVQRFWRRHTEEFRNEYNFTTNDVHSFIAHPGGKKVLEAMEEVLEVTSEKLKHSYNVLKNHGNMSSSTVLYVLYEWLKEDIPEQGKSVISALGPGFSSELLLMEWNKK